MTFANGAIVLVRGDERKLDVMGLPFTHEANSAVRVTYEVNSAVRGAWGFAASFRLP
jgi:hypothetical protein